jgi:hypothetical protein
MKAKLFRGGLVLLAIGAGIVVLLEVFELQPEFSVGRFHSKWVGIKHMDWGSGTTTAPVRNGRKVIQRDYGLGPLKIAITS